MSEDDDSDHDNNKPPVVPPPFLTKPPPMARGVSGGIPGPGSFARNVSGGVAMPRLTSQSSMGVRMQPSVDWRTFLTIEERLAVRNKINNAYTGSCKTYEELLDTVVAIEEELLYISAPSRLDYFKSGLEFESRVGLKRKQLQGKREGGSSSEDTDTAKKAKQ
jgi:hypothetical protein